MPYNESFAYKIEYDGFDVNIKADKKQIEQVIYNLINNALNYTGNDKKVTIKIIDKKEEDKIRIEVIEEYKHNLER